MNCLIDETLKKALGRGKRPAVIARYLRMKYKVVADSASLKKRIEHLAAQKRLSKGYLRSV